MTQQAEEAELSNLAKYGAELHSRAYGVLHSMHDAEAMIEARSLYSVLLRRCEVERKILKFTAEASKRRWTVESYKSSLIATFYRLVREYFGNYERPDDCADCNEHCYAERYCICLSRELNIYGCLNHASIHECVTRTEKKGAGLVIVPSDCPCRGTSQQTDEVCVFSGNVISKILFDGNGSSKDFSSDDAVTRSQAGYQFLLSMNQAEEMRNNFDNFDVEKRNKLRLKKKPLPEKEEKPPVSQIVIKLDEDGNPISHEMLLDRTASDDGVPALLRMNSANSSSDSAITNVSKKRQLEQTMQKKRAKLSESNYFEFRKSAIIEEAERYLSGVAETILTDIMYDKEARTQINVEQLSRLSGNMKKSLTTYHWMQKRSNVMPNLVSCLAAFNTPSEKLKMLRLVERSVEQISLFCNRAVTLWRICHHSPAVFEKKTAPTTFKKFSIALLYCMRNGLSIPAQGMVWTDTDAREKIVVLPRDPIIAVDLPDENLLCYFGKKGREIIADAFKNGGSVNTTASNMTQRQRGKITRFEGIPQRIDVDGLGSVMTRSFLPVYLHDESIEDTGCYSSSDVSIGLAFFKECIASFSEEARRCLAMT